mgnify:CR=1 FL=1
MKKIDKNIKQKKGTESSENRFIVLYNDDFNTFDYVIECLIDVCQHDANQAEQCALFTHYKGKCDIKSGSYDELKPLKELLLEKGLSVNIN